MAALFLRETSLATAMASIIPFNCSQDDSILPPSYSSLLASLRNYAIPSNASNRDKLYVEDTTRDQGTRNLCKKTKRRKVNDSRMQVSEDTFVLKIYNTECNYISVPIKIIARVQ